MSFKIDWLKHGIFTKWSGTATSKEIITFLETIQSNSKFDHLQFSIHDYLDCKQISFNPNDMDYVGALDKAGSEINPRIKVAIIANHQELIEMVAGYKRLALSPYDTEIFDDLSKAKKWLESFEIVVDL